MKRVAVKFCGGCDPTYDRGEYFERIRAAARDLIEFVSLDEGGHEAVLIISGCQTACPREALEFEPSLKVVSLTDGDAEPGQVVENLLK